MNRTENTERGDLNGTKDAISTLAFEQDWTLDFLGNWDTFKQDDDGDATWDLDQPRTHNKVNEITDIAAATGSNWADPAHDRAGNMTTMPQPNAPTSSYTATYDAWNRLVKLEDGANTVAGVRIRRAGLAHRQKDVRCGPAGRDATLLPLQQLAGHRRTRP